jgi:hypothetical protein
METSNSLVSREALMTKVVDFCNWAEGNEGYYALLHQDNRDDYQGPMVQSRLGELRKNLETLFDHWPHNTFIVDLSRHRYPLNACCAIGDTVGQIEKDRGLPEKSLESRIVLVDYDFDTNSPHYQALMQKEQQRVEEAVLTRSPPPVNPLVAALAMVDL